MKARVILVLLLTITGMMASGQSPAMELKFTSENNGLYVQLDSIKVMNLTQAGDTVLYWPDTVLSLYYTGIPEIKKTEDVFQVFQNYPNPVVNQTTISLYVPEKDDVGIIIADMLGRVILKMDRVLEKGFHTFRFTIGSGNLFFFVAQWRGKSSSIKILHHAAQENRVSSLEYLGGDLATPRLKAREDIQSFFFSSGDELLYIGYANSLQSGMLDTPETDETYTFQFATNIPCPGTPTVNYEGRIYNTIQIFSQCWLKENLNVGTMIQGSQEMTDNGLIEKYCYNNEPDSCTKYGGLYQWDEMMQYTTVQGVQGICPPAWHVAIDEEWNILEGSIDSQYGIGNPIWADTSGRGYDAGHKLKSTEGWYNEGNGIDEFGFTGLPGGFLFGSGFFTNISRFGYWWAASEYDVENAWSHTLYFSDPDVYRYYGNKTWGFNVRCVSDNQTGGSPGNLVAHWLFNGDADDATGNGNNGTPTEGHPWFGGGAVPQLAADRFGNANYCYHFDEGSNIEVPYSTALNPQSMTISLWIKMEEQPNYDYIIAMNRWNGWKLCLQELSYLFFTIKTTYNGDTTWYDRDSNPYAIDANTWTHVAITFTNGFMKFYGNGELQRAWDNTNGIPVAVNNINLTIGSDLPTDVYTTEEGDFFVGWGGYFKGNIDDVRFYNTVLSAFQVDSVYTFEKDNVVEE